MGWGVGLVTPGSLDATADPDPRRKRPRNRPSVLFRSGTGLRGLTHTRICHAGSVLRNIFTSVDASGREMWFVDGCRVLSLAVHLTPGGVHAGVCRRHAVRGGGCARLRQKAYRGASDEWNRTLGKLLARLYLLVVVSLAFSL